jgi:hypothetical protein
MGLKIQCVKLVVLVVMDQSNGKKKDAENIVEVMDITLAFAVK